MIPINNFAKVGAATDAPSGKGSKNEILGVPNRKGGDLRRWLRVSSSRVPNNQSIEVAQAAEDGVCKHVRCSDAPTDLEAKSE